MCPAIHQYRWLRHIQSIPLHLPINPANPQLQAQVASADGHQVLAKLTFWPEPGPQGPFGESSDLIQFLLRLLGIGLLLDQIQQRLQVLSPSGQLPLLHGRGPHLKNLLYMCPIRQSL